MNEPAVRRLATAFLRVSEGENYETVGQACTSHLYVAMGLALQAGVSREAVLAMFDESIAFLIIAREQIQSTNPRAAS